MLRILPTGMCFFPALYSMLVNVLFASCMSVGGCSAAKALLSTHSHGPC